MKPDIEKIKSEKSVEELLEFGIINIDKPSGPTSFSVSDFVHKKLGLRKTSHFGTLDPKVTGVLPVGLNRACKLTGFFLGEDKEYVGIMRFHEKVEWTPKGVHQGGASSSSSPRKISGEIITRGKVEETIKKKFLGKITQMPPVRSRVKRADREREIKNFELLEISESGKDILFRVECEGGTYIRKLVSDLGDFIGVGAHMLELRRVRAGIFLEDGKYPCYRVYDLEKAAGEFEKGDDKLLKEMIIPGEIVSEVYPPVEINENDLKHILTGKPIFKEDLVDKKDWKLKKGKVISVFTKKRFVGMYKVILEGDVFAKSEFVMQEMKKEEKEK